MNFRIAFIVLAIFAVAAEAFVTDGRRDSVECVTDKECFKKGYKYKCEGGRCDCKRKLFTEANGKFSRNYGC